MSPICRALLPAVVAAIACPAARAQDANALQLRSLAATCAQCHGSDGRGVPGSIVPALAGLPASYTIEQMAAFKAATRPATVMTQLAKGYSDAQIRQLAAYFAAPPQ
ncbi:MAG: c-type cytochrome [Caldimonas sp.]